MRKPTFLSAVALLLIISLGQSQEQSKVKLPADGDNNGAAAIAALKASTRHGEWVDVEMPGSETKIKSFVVYPERPDKAGVVIVIHEIFGLSDWVRGVADQLASEGFIAIAPDLVSGMGPGGGGTESLGNNATRTVSSLPVDEQFKRLEAVRDYALKIPAANGKIGTVGFCWGGTASFNYAARQPKLNGAIVYYGTAPSKELMARIECPVLGCYGGNDARVTATVEPTKAT
ncbi:MAG TPA: dienelactone hydrolase family protein, partial [Tepidisphaeraceae bacterium]|nr:dienelactone hydrolase family protein [Tepidisphaeraceae bacterium]